jgi:UPF0755 protein
MTKTLRLAILLFVICCVVGLLGYFWWQNNTKPVASTTQKQSFLIKKGQSGVLVGRDLEEQGLIKSALAFKIYIQVKGLSEKLPAGEYLISPSYSLPQVVDTFLSGPTEVWVTIPEGLRREEIVERVIDGLSIEKTLQDEFRSEFLSLTKNSEGYLFPDTYLFPKEASAQKVVSVLTSTFDKKVDAKMREDLKKTGLTLPNAVILASLIERETRSDDERPIVAGLLLARIDEGFYLQTDASLQYALANAQCAKTASSCTNWWPQVSRDDYTSLASPYNVYKYFGFPPTPISNPGISSLKAVVYPQETEYRYYIHDTNGRIHFAETLDEHNQNVRTYLR